MPGYAHIVRLGLREGTYGRTVGDYQFTYNASGKTWARTFEDEDSLAEFLVNNAAIPRDIADPAMSELARVGNATIANVEIPETEAGAMGLEQMPSET